MLGLAAANGWTEVLWRGSAAILLFNVAVPRRRRTVEADDSDGDPDVGARPAARVRHAGTREN